MSALPQRLEVGGATLDPSPTGSLVRFSDVEEALQDSDRLDWLMPVLAGDHDDRVGDLRTQALAAGLLLGKSGRALIDYAREGSP